MPAITDVAEPETDYLFRIRKGYYYGHPNPVRHEYVLNGGNPTAGVDPYELAEYPVGTKPDPHWQPAAFDMGMHESPDGAIEYHGSARSAGRSITSSWSSVTAAAATSSR